MTIDVIDLRDFYSRRLGIVARQLINRGIRARWPDAEGLRVLGLGYPTPYLGLFREDSRTLHRLHAGGAGRAEMADRAAGARDADRRIFDAAAGCGRGPHPAGPRAGDVGRSGTAAARSVARAGAVGPADRSDSQPARRVDAHRQHAVRSRPALFARADHAIAAADLVHADGVGRGAVPAAGRQGWFLRSAMAWERVGAALSLPFAGVHIVEATKQVYRAIPAHRERTRLIPVAAAGAGAVVVDDGEKVAKRADTLSLCPPCYLTARDLSIVRPTRFRD
jgi:hypothetical protein